MHGSTEILHRLQDVKIAKSERKAVTGDGVCIGLTYNDRALIHPVAMHNKTPIGNSWHRCNSTRSSQIFA